jgi:hypothetical protein
MCQVEQRHEFHSIERYRCEIPMRYSTASYIGWLHTDSLVNSLNEQPRHGFLQDIECLIETKYNGQAVRNFDSPCSITLPQHSLPGRNYSTDPVMLRKYRGGEVREEESAHFRMLVQTSTARLLGVRLLPIAKCLSSRSHRQLGSVWLGMSRTNFLPQ